MPEEDELDWLIRRALQQSVAGATPPPDLWWHLRRDLIGGPGLRRRAVAGRSQQRGPAWLVAAARLSSLLNRLWAAPLSSDQAMLLEQKWVVLLGFAPLGRVY